MIAVGLLLAAGGSRRFGPADKLLAPLDGRPLVCHAAAALRAVPLDRRIAVVANRQLLPYLDGFEIVAIDPGLQSDSLRAGVTASGATDRLLIALGDMPDVTPAHLVRVLDRATDALPSASRSGDAVLPPACFPRGWLPRLTALSGDQGAGRVLRDLPRAQTVPAPDLLEDIDRQAQLERRNATPQT